jgi:S-adenosylmethionine synthetase
MGRIPEVKTLTFKDGSGQQITKEVELFTWEKLDYTDKVKAAFAL